MDIRRERPDDLTPVRRLHLPAFGGHGAVPDAAFQVVALPASESWMTGTLVYSQTFWEHDAVGLRDDDE